MNDNKESQQKRMQQEGKRPYEAPAIIYTGIISTRAGSPLGGGNSDPVGVDPADLFGN
jgi:hypothetical protein